MGWFRRLLGGEPSSGFAQWAELPWEPSAAWERRLRNHAVNSARRLQAAHVPLFRCVSSRGGVGTYADDFWLIAVDVGRANRSYVENSLNPAEVRKGDFVGGFRGDALLLSAAGGLHTAEAEGFFGRDGTLQDHAIDVIFHRIARNAHQLQREDWGWSNRGRWRPDRRSDITAHNLRLFTGSIAFESRYPAGANSAEDGRGTSAAVSAFVKSGGSVRYPRQFLTFGH